MTNPYQGQDGYERAWSDGYAAGHHAGGNATPNPPSFFPPYDLDATQLSYFQQVWNEGFLAGQQAPINPNVVHHPDEGSTAIGEAGHAVEIGAAVVFTAIIERHPVVAAVEIFLAVMVPSGAPQWDQEQGDLNQWFAAACKEYSWEEFFIPVMWGQSEEAPGWHGQVYRDYESAKHEADPHVRAGHQVSIAHYRCDSPYIIEQMELALQTQ